MHARKRSTWRNAGYFKRNRSQHKQRTPILQVRARLSALWNLTLTLSATKEYAEATGHLANMQSFQKVRGGASNQSITTTIASCGKRKQKQVGISKRRYECGGLIWRGTYLRMPGTSTSSASTKTGSRMFTLRNVQKGGHAQAGSVRVCSRPAAAHRGSRQART